jgi:hypothetical protein
VEQIAGYAGDASLAQADPQSGSACPICNLQSPNCLTVEGTQPTFLIIVGDPGLGEHNVGNGFSLAAQQKTNDLQSQGNRVVACRASSAQQFDNALVQHGYINGGVIYFGHSGPYTVSSSNNQVLGEASILAVGQGSDTGTNVDYDTVSLFSNVNSQTGYPNQSILGPSASITLNGCRARENVYDYYAGGTYSTSIAQQIANQTRRGVYAYKVGMYFSSLDAANDTKTAPKKGDLAPTGLPAYLIPVGPPGHKPNPTPFTPY